MGVMYAARCPKLKPGDQLLRHNGWRGARGPPTCSRSASTHYQLLYTGGEEEHAQGGLQLLLSHFDPFVKQEASSSKPFLGSMYNEVCEKPFNMDTATVFFYQTISFSYMLKYFQLQYLKRLQYTAKKMTGLSKVAKEANKGLKFLDTRYTYT